MKGRFLIVCFLMFIVSNSYGQTTNSFISLNNFIPPSPDAAALGRYGQIPISYSSGIPSIGVPVYEIKSGKITLPISFSYHASGIKVEDVATTAGLGWVLNAGGAISRNIVGKRDEVGVRDSYVTYKSRSQIDILYTGPGDTNLTYLKNMSGGMYDTQSDVYDVNTPTFTGRFVFDIATKQINYSPVDKQIKINWIAADTTFTIIDESGIKYVFGEKEKTESQFTTDITAWYISQVISADLADTVFLKYKSASLYKESYESDKYTAIIEPDYPQGNIGYCPIPKVHDRLDASVSNLTYYRKLIDTIRFANGFVKFNYASDRQDPVAERLSSIVIGSGISTVKQMTLSQSYFQSISSSTEKQTRRLRLDKLNWVDRDGIVVNSYSFEYNGILLPEYCKGYNPFPIGKTKGYDFWGYYNAKFSNPGPIGALSSTIPSQFRIHLSNFLANNLFTINNSILDSYDLQSVDRYVDSFYTQACMLTKMTYPTGGFTQYEFENNKVSNTGTMADYSGGLRIRKMVSNDGVNGTITNSYTYGDSAGMGTSISRIVPDDFYFTQATYNKSPTVNAGVVFCNHINFSVSSSPTTAINYYGGSPVFYQKVTEFNGTPDNNKGKTEFLFDYEIDSVYSSDDTFRYWNFSTDKSWARGALLQENVYKNINGNYIKIKKKENRYQKFGEKRVKVGYLCEQKNGYVNITLDNYVEHMRFFDPNSAFLLEYFEYVDVVLVYGVKMLMSTIETEYNNADSISVTTKYNYESLYHLYPTKITTVSSKADSVSVVSKYPQDKAQIQNLSAAASAAIDGMVSKNILTNVIETEKYKNSVLLYRDRTDYANWNNSNRFYEQFKSEQVLQNPLDQRIEYKSYDKRGNVLTLSKKGDVNISYLWDYDGAYPVAEIRNADSASFAYTSFEADGKGNWVFAGSSIIDPTAITGAKVYNPASGAITKAIATTAVYIVSYWSKNGAKSITGTTAKSGRSINGWTYYENKGSLGAGSTITINESGVLDELRLYPATAQMTTYTYYPLIGQTSMADPNGEIVYYEYDAFNRLKNVKDYQGNIIKNFQYNYINTCGNNCVVLPMQTFNGSNTIGYPVGVFNVNGQLLGNATTQAQYITMWNANSINQAKGVLSAGTDALHFNLALAANQTPPPAVVGLRYYQFDLDYTQFDGARFENGEIIDFGDGITLRIGNSFNRNNLPANTSMANPASGRIIHTYPNNNLKTLTFYHNDASEFPIFGNYYNPATSSTKLKNLRGNFPQYVQTIGNNDNLESSFNTVANISNWNTINSVTTFLIHNGDGMNPATNMSFAQDFMATNKGLKSIQTDIYGAYRTGYRDLNFKISRLKSDWNTYFKNLDFIAINEDHWNHEDLTALTKLNKFWLTATTQNHLDDFNSPLLPLTSQVIDNVINQIASGAGNAGVLNGEISFLTGGSARTSASNAAVNQLKSAGWTIALDYVIQ